MPASVADRRRRPEDEWTVAVMRQQRAATEPVGRLDVSVDDSHHQIVVLAALNHQHAVLR